MLKSILPKKEKQNKEVSSKSPFCVIGPFCTTHSIYLNIDRKLLTGRLVSKILFFREPVLEAATGGVL